jgi:FG-GAP-like repeat
VRLKAGGAAVRVEAPGYAAPCLADVDGDGKLDLLVGQFRQGKIQVFKGLGAGKFATGTWLQAEGKAAEVPGVW